MNLSELCIKRPVFACVLSLILILIGLISYCELTVRFAPLYFKPILMVSTDVAGGSPEFVEQSVTEQLEQSLESTTGLDYMFSSSTQGQSNIILNFDDLTEQQFILAESQVMQNISSTVLPNQTDHPYVYQHGTDSLVMLLGVTDDTMPSVDLANYINNTLLQEITALPGVAGVNVEADIPALRISLDPKRMASMGISVDDIANAVQNTNSAYPLGQIFTNAQALELNAKMLIPDLAGFNNVVVAKRGGRIIHLSDVADVGVDWSNLAHFYGYVGGHPGIILDVLATNDANPIEVSARVRQLIGSLQGSLPVGMKITPSFDLGKPLAEAIDEVYFTIFLAIVLVIAVTFGFLGNWRATLIPIVTIPVCLLAAFGVMALLGFTINIMTLLALVVGVGLVVDDAIVVLENTYRHIEAGETPMVAAFASIKEISFAILGITLCLVAVYLPALFLPRSMDTTYFQEFAFTLAGAILISGFLALTLSPMMCSRLLKPIHSSLQKALPEENPPLQAELAPRGDFTSRQVSCESYEQRLSLLINKLKTHYAHALDWALSRQKKILIFLIANACLGLLFYSLLPTALLPKSELNYIHGSLVGANSASPDALNQAITPFRESLEHNPEFKNVLFYVNGDGSVGFMLQLKGWAALRRDAIAQQLNQQINRLPDFNGGTMVVDANQYLGSRHEGSLYFYITGLAEYPEIVDATQRLQTALQKVPGVSSTFNHVQLNQQQYDLNINRNVATALGVDLGTLNQTLQAMLGGYTLPNSTYQVDGYGYPIVMQLPASALNDLSVLKGIYIINKNGQEIPVSQLITVTPAIDLSERDHVNGLRAGELDINMAAGYSQGQVMHQVEAVAKQILPQNLHLTWGGEARTFLQNSASGNFFVALGLLFIFLILAALFESFTDPLIILCTVPFCVVAALIALYLMGGSINIYTKIALVTLMGLVSKHGVLITHLANERLKAGMSAMEAVKDAALTRFRPILMTSLTMILGALPLILSFGTDANGRRQIGVVIVFGLLFGTVFSLFVVPVAWLAVRRVFRYNGNQ